MSSARGCRWLGGALGALLGLLLLATTMLSAQAQAQALIPVELGAQVSVPLGSEFEVLEDPAAQWQLDDILRAELARQFRVPGSSGSNFGYSRSAFWLHARVHLAAGAPERWLLEAANPTLEYLDVYVVTPAAGVVDAQHGAGMAKFAQRAVAHRNHVKPLQLQPGVDNELYIRVASRLTLSFPLHLWQPDALLPTDQL